MSNATFVDVKKPDAIPGQEKALYFRAEGESEIDESNFIVTFVTTDGRSHSLIPDPVKPWFKLANSGGAAPYVFGSHQNTPTADNRKDVSTLPVVHVTTVKGETIETLLALSDRPSPTEPLAGTRLTRDILEGLIESSVPDEADEVKVRSTVTRKKPSPELMN